MPNVRQSAPSWLFSFVDLAFLLLIATTQLGGEGFSEFLQLGEIRVPRIQSSAATRLPEGSGQRWQLRVHPPGDLPRSPFELARADDAASGVAGPRLRTAELRRELIALRVADEDKPLLAPHANSRSVDLLRAVGLLEDFWPSRRQVTIAPVSALQ